MVSTSPIGSCVLRLTCCFSLDYEIFRLHDEVTAAEGAGVTFYGTYSQNPVRANLRESNSDSNSNVQTS